MSEDFVTQLRLQLREAAEQENRRGPVRRTARSVLSQGGGPATVAALLVAAAALVAAVLPIVQADDPAPAGGGLRIIADQPLVTRGGDLAVAGGAVWASDPQTGQILRIDPGTREVLSRVPAVSRPGGDTPLRAGQGALWAGSGAHLLRIDPRRGDVTGRLQLRQRGVGFPVPGAAGHMWVIDAIELRRIDSERMVFDRTVQLDRGGFMARAVATDGDTIYVQLGDGTIRGYDAATGDRVAAVRADRPEQLEQASGGALVLTADDRVELVDARTNTTRWLRPLGTFAVNGAVIHGSTVWVHGSDDRTAADRLWRLDLRDGRVLSSITLPEFGVTAMHPVRDELWLVTDGGRLTVVRSG